jgi:hypothetical protein
MQEYISISEALEVTGLAEKTLRAKLRGKVPMFGRNSYDRQRFFDFWNHEFEQKCLERRKKATALRIQINNILARNKR